MREERRREGASESVGRGRLETLSDGVFAIVLTLLVLELQVPHVVPHDSPAALGRALLGIAPKFVSWAISFVTVCVIWLNHHRVSAMLRRIDHGLYWWNANLLFWTSSAPFPTALMGDYPRNRLAVSFYGMVMLAMGIAFVLLRWHLIRHPGLLEERVDLSEFRRGTIYTILMGPVAYGTGAGLAWVSPWLSFACYAAIALYFVFPHATRASSGPGGAGGVDRQ